MARPTKLTAALKLQAERYLKDNSTFASTMLPTIEGLALYLHVHRDSIYAWEESSKGFSDILEEIRQAQAEKLIQNSLQGRYNSTIAKMMLTKHGYVEKSAVENSGEQKVTVEIKKYAE